MISRIRSIANDICEKLDNTIIKEHIQEQINYHLEELKEDNLTNDRCIHYLLYITCQFNMLKDMHKLLDLGLYSNIDQPLEPKQKIQMAAFEKQWQWIQDKNDYGKTLLGLAAYFGHVELVKYLVEVRLADINHKDSQGDTPLHQVVYGDSCRNNPNFQDKIAKYLINNGGDITIQNNHNETPYDRTLRCAPGAFAKLIGRRLIDPASFVYDADKVRPIFEKYIAKNYFPTLDIDGHKIPMIPKISERRAKDFDLFCLEHAIKGYVNKNKVGFGFLSIEELNRKLDAISDEEAKEVSRVISSQEPAPSSNLGFTSNQLPRFAKQSAAIGIGACIVTYYETQGILLPLFTGIASAYLAFSYLISIACKEKVEERMLINKRMDKLQEHDRFFKPLQVATIPSEQLERLKANINEIFVDRESNKLNLPGKLRYN